MDEQILQLDCEVKQGDMTEKLIYQYHKEKHPRMYKRWMKDLVNVESGKLQRFFEGKLQPISELEKKLLIEARAERMV